LNDQDKWKGIDPVLFFKDHAVIKNIVSFFGIEDSFSLEGRLVTRSTDNARRIYYISKSVQEILELNVQVGEQIKIASVGVKMFVSAPNRQFNFPFDILPGIYTIFIEKVGILFNLNYELILFLCWF
jgi:hypothetical protein